MAPAMEPQKRVKSIKKPGETQISEPKKMQKYVPFSSFANEKLRKVLKKNKGQLNEKSIRLIRTMFRNMTKLIGLEAHGLVCRRKNKVINIEDAEIIISNILSGDLGVRAHLSAMKAIDDYMKKANLVLPTQESP